MAFLDSQGYPLINDDNKVRITLSNYSRMIMQEDMIAFETDKEASFVNTVFDNYRDEAKASICFYLESRKAGFENLFANAKLDTKSKRICFDELLKEERRKISAEIDSRCKMDGETKVYRINQKNVSFLLEDCNENQHYKRPGLYIRAVIEEYCSLPFIERERIYRKDIYKLVEHACENKRILKVQVPFQGKDITLSVYPYKIVPDAMRTQSYLVCYSRRKEEDDAQKRIASFSMAKFHEPRELRETFYLNKAEIAALEDAATNDSPAFLLGDKEIIKVRLSKKGIEYYRTFLFNRPDKDETLSTENVYAFNCTPLQIFNYFFKFKDNAEVISPPSVRESFKKAYLDGAKIYE